MLDGTFNGVGISRSVESCCDSFTVVSKTLRIPKSLEGSECVFSGSSLFSGRVGLVVVRFSEIDWIDRLKVEQGVDSLFL